MLIKAGSVFFEQNASGKILAFVSPTLFMNLNGKTVKDIFEKCQFSNLTNLIVIHDELELKSGAVKVKQGGSSKFYILLRKWTQWFEVNNRVFQTKRQFQESANRNR